MFATFRAAILGLLAVTAAPHAELAAESTIDLTPEIQPDEVAQVSIQLEAGGHTLVRLPADEVRKADEEQQQRLAMSVSAKLRYFERRLIPGGVSASRGSQLAVRHYEVAEAVIKVDQSGVAPELPEDRRLVVVEQGAGRPSLYCPQGPLSREQLDLIDTVGNSCVVDQLLPQKPVADGESWPSEASVMAALLTLDTLAVCEVQNVLEEYNSSFAKVRLAGTVHGTVDGAATQQEVRGVYLFDRRLRRITRLNLAVCEQRSIGEATPGLDAVAKLQITIDPLQDAPQLSDTVIAGLRRPTRLPARDLEYEAATMGFRIQHDRQWFVTSRQRETVTLRRVEGTDLIAQCTFALLPSKSAGRQTSLNEFQKDVIHSLGPGFGQLVSGRQWQNAHGHYCYEVVARGTVEQVPVEWHYYLVARESGHRVSAAVTIEGPAVARVANADRDLIERLELFPPLPAAQTATQSTQSAPK
jgi:hypothetical protein